jgi:hypothetical protein
MQMKQLKPLIPINRASSSERKVDATNIKTGIENLASLPPIIEINSQPNKKVVELPPAPEIITEEITGPTSGQNSLDGTWPFPSKENVSKVPQNASKQHSVSSSIPPLIPIAKKSAVPPLTPISKNTNEVKVADGFPPLIPISKNIETKVEESVIGEAVEVKAEETDEIIGEDVDLEKSDQKEAWPELVITRKGDGKLVEEIPPLAPIIRVQPAYLLLGYVPDSGEYEIKAIYTESEINNLKSENKLFAFCQLYFRTLSGNNEMVRRRDSGVRTLVPNQSVLTEVHKTVYGIQAIFDVVDNGKNNFDESYVCYKYIILKFVMNEFKLNVPLGLLPID